jgi:hypothetical protein
MTPFLANLLVGAILALVGWSIAFGIWVVKEIGARKDDYHRLDKRIEGMKAEFVTQVAWSEFNHRFDQWKDNVLDKIGGLGKQIAAITGKTD